MKDLRSEIEEIINDLDCGYCESDHDHDKSRIEGLDAILTAIRSKIPKKKKNTFKEDVIVPVPANTEHVEKIYNGAFNKAIDEINKKIG